MNHRRTAARQHIAGPEGVYNEDGEPLGFDYPGDPGEDDYADSHDWDESADDDDQENWDEDWSHESSRRTAGDNDRPAGAAPMVDQCDDNPEDDSDMFGGEWVYEGMPSPVSKDAGLHEDFDLWSIQRRASRKTAVKMEVIDGLPYPEDGGNFKLPCVLVGHKGRIQLISSPSYLEDLPVSTLDEAIGHVLQRVQQNAEMLGTEEYTLHVYRDVRTASRKTAANDDGIMEAAKVVADYWGGAGSKIGTPQKSTIQLEDGPYEAVFVNITSGDGDFYRVQDISGQVNRDDLVNYRPDPANPGKYTWDKGYIPKNTYKVFSRYDALFTLRKLPDGRWQKNPDYKGEIITTASRKTAMPAPADMGVSVGDIFYSSWGYDQTNIDFYEVVGLTPAGLKVRQVGKKFVSQRGPEGNKVVPDRGNYIGESMTKRLQATSWNSTPEPYFSLNSYSSARLWDGTPKYETDSMYGH